MKDLQKQCEDISSWIRDAVYAANAKGVVLGLSGGIDSAVAAALCKKAFPEDTLCLMLPCHSNPKDEEDARLVASKLKLRTKKIVLDQTYDILRQSFGSQDFDSRLLLGNIKSRLRMVTLYYYAGRHNYLVVGPTNKSELVIGYYTKHGDSGVDIMPIADFVKGEIYELAKYLGVPKELIDKVPTAGLWENQTDEQEMKMSYKEIDDYINNGIANETIKNKIDAMHNSSEHKRNAPKIFMRKQL